MAKIILVTGGSRSGKSSHAQGLAESLPGPRGFVATCPAVDDEMRQRIAKHRKARAKTRWRTIEETLDLAGVIGREGKCRVLLIECLTLWINNIMYEAERRKRPAVTEGRIARRCREILAAAKKHPGTIIFVTNEVGMGIVPDNALARKYRDLVGRCNQTIAAGADEVVLVTCGIAIQIKGRRS